MKPKLKELLLASFSFEEYNPLYTKVLLLNALLFSAIIINFVFVFINLFVNHAYVLMAINLFIFIFSALALYVLRERQDHMLAGYIGNVALFIGFLLVVVLFKGSNYTLIWSYFFAPFAIITLGASRGLLVAFVFIVMVFGITYTGIGVWEEGSWNLQSYVRFMIAHILMLYIIYAIQNSYERANKKIEQLRQKEKEQLKLFEKLSITDPLTSLYNRRFLNEIFIRQINNTRRNEKVFAFFLLDMDYFKQYNDSYGHQKGDWALQQVAEVLSSVLRRSEDYAFRIGGEEFAGIVVGEDTKSIEIRIMSILHALKACDIECENALEQGVLTCSIGAYVVKDESEYSFNEIYRTADEALYKAKADGRDRVIYV